MTERQLAAKYKKQLKEEFPGIAVHSHKDTFGGHKRPYDFYGCYKGRMFAVEFKVKGETVKPHQWQALGEIQSAGGFAEVLWIEDNKICRDYLREWLVEL